MKPHLLSALLVVAALLAGILGCSKKDDPASPTGSYKISGQLKTCRVTTSPVSPSNNTGNDYIAMLFTTTPEPSGGPEVLQILLTKVSGQPATAYQPLQFTLLEGGHIINSFPVTIATTFTVTSTRNGVMGTFSSVSPYSNLNFPPITEGVFTNVPL